MPIVPCPSNVELSAVKSSVWLVYTLYEARSDSPFLFQKIATPSSLAFHTSFVASYTSSGSALRPEGANGAPSVDNSPAVSVKLSKNA